MAETKELAEEHTTLLASLLKNLGFLLSEKSVFHPAQAIEFLEMVMDSIATKLKVPGKRSGRQPETSWANRLGVSEGGVAKWWGE